MKVFNLNSTVKLLVASIFSLATITVNAQTIINPGFESVTVSGTDTMPDNWVSSSPFGIGAKEISNSGTYSLAVWNWYYYGKGIAFNGAPGFDPARAGTPFSQKASKLTGFYSYKKGATPDTDDSARIVVMMKKYNSSTSYHDTIAYGEIRVPLTSPDGTFYPFEVNITDLAPGIDPDSVVIYLQSSLEGMCDNSSDGECLYLYVDDLALETVNGIFSAEKWMSTMQISPNPAYSDIYIKWTENTVDRIIIRSIDGRIIVDNTVNGNQYYTSDLTLFNTGIYFVELYASEKNISNQKLIIQK
jgi:hypothetical protein